MKWLGLSALFFSCTLLASDLTEEQAKQLFNDKQYTQLIETIDDLSPYQLAKYKVLSLSRIEKFDSAIALLDQRLEQIQPENKEALAKEWLQKGNVFANQAMDASIFTAAGYADDSLEAYKKAHALDPDDLETNASLIGFYRSAPGFVGGDVEKAIELSKVLEKQYPFEAGLLLTYSYLSADDTEKAELKLKAMQKTYPQNHELALQAAYFYDNEERYQDNQKHLMNALSWPEPKDESQKSEWFMLHYSLAKNSVKTKTNLKAALTAITRFKLSPKSVVDGYEQWPLLREAQIRLLMGQKKQAVKLAKQARANSDDSKLRKKAKRIIKKGRI